MAEIHEVHTPKETQVRESMLQRLVTSGEKERLKEHLREKLVECGWRDEMKAYCRDVIRNKGVEKLTVEDLIGEVTPRGREMIPDTVKADMLQRIRLFLQSSE